MSTNPDATAFPVSNEPQFYNLSGLTKREYFAAMALQGLLANDRMTDDEAKPSGVAVTAVTMADALIAALNKEPKTP